MKKLLVTSQQSGVGKTTTAINLAAATAMAGARVLLAEADPLCGVATALNLTQHPDRRTLRDAGIALPGVLCTGVVPGLDVLNPYEEGCSDDDLSRVLQLLTSQAFRESYDCLVVDAPPFLGARPDQLLACCDEFVVVMQADPLAHRTMPAFLERVQRVIKEGSLTSRMRGIVLTLPESESPGGHGERELRGRFAHQVLTHTVPYDPEANQAALFGHVLVHNSPDAPAATAYLELAEELQLARGAAGQARRAAETTLALAAATVEFAPPPPKPASLTYAGRKSSGRMPRIPSTAGGDPYRALPVPAATPKARSHSGISPSSIPTATAAAVNPDHAPAWHSWGALAVAGGIIGGVGLRFIELPRLAVPVIVGVGSAAGVLLALRFLVKPEDETTARGE